MNTLENAYMTMDYNDFKLYLRDRLYMVRDDPSNNMHTYRDLKYWYNHANDIVVKSKRAPPSELSDDLTVLKGRLDYIVKLLL